MITVICLVKKFNLPYVTLHQTFVFVRSLFLRFSLSFLVHSNCCGNVFTSLVVPYARMYAMYERSGKCRGNISAKVEGTRTFTVEFCVRGTLLDVGESGPNSATNFSTLS